MEENNLENKMASVQNTNQGNGQKQIVGAIIIAGIIIAGAILLKGTNTGTTAGTGGTVTKVSTAKKIGLNVKSFQACLASGKFKDKIQADIDDGSRAGVNGTPSSFILRDGVVVDNIGGANRLNK